MLLSSTARSNVAVSQMRLAPNARVDVCREGHEDEQSTELDARRPQGRVGLPFFHEVWDLEQANQSHQARKAQRADQLGGPAGGNKHEQMANQSLAWNIGEETKYYWYSVYYNIDIDFGTECQKLSDVSVSERSHGYVD